MRKKTKQDRKRKRTREQGPKTMRRNFYRTTTDKDRRSRRR